MSSPNPFPNFSLPGISPRQNYCIYRVNRVFDGTFEGSRGRSYPCGTRIVGQVTSFPTAIAWRTSPMYTCDESEAIWPASMLIARGTTIIRPDEFAHFIGQFSIVKREEGKPDVLYFEGRLELIGRSGSHQALGEICDAEEHIEGWLIGRGLQPVLSYTLRAVIVAKAKLSKGGGPFPDTTVNRITGTLLKSV